MWNFEIIDSIPESVQSEHVFFHPAMIEAWMKTYVPLRKMTPIYIKGVNGESAMYLPLVLWTRNWKNAFVRTLVAIGYSDFDYHDPIVNGERPDKEAISSFWSELISFLKSKYTIDSFTIEGITDAMAYGSDWQKGEICPRLDLKDVPDEDSLMKFFKTSLRGDLRRQMRRLEEIGPLRLREFHSWEDIPEETFTQFMHQHALRWPNAYKAPHFHENLLKIGLRAGVVHFSTLLVGETEIAWHLGFTYKGRYYYYMPAGNKDFSKFSPTKVHLFFLMRRAVEQGYEVYDHLRGDENYKSGWSNGFIHVNTFSGTTSSIRTIVRDSLLKIRHLPPPTRDNQLGFTTLRCAA
nr:GNAT family N-acetyltransferase [Bacteroides sp.]